MDANGSFHAVSFRVGSLRLALEAEAVLRVMAAVALLPAPGAPGVLLGIANLAGELLPVADVSFRLGLGRTVLTPRHAFILARSTRRRLLLAVDAVEEAFEAERGDFLPRAGFPGADRNFSGALRRADGSIWIQDIDAFLSWEEEAAVDRVLAARTGGAHAS